MPLQAQAHRRFALELRDVAGIDVPEKELTAKAANVDTERLVNMAVYGSGNTVISGSHAFHAVTNERDDLDGLLAAVGKLGFQRGELEALKQAVIEGKSQGKRPDVTGGATLDSNRIFCCGHSNSCSKDRGPRRRARLAFRRGLSYRRFAGRLPVDVEAEIRWHFSAEIRGALHKTDDNSLASGENRRLTRDYAFSPTANSADLKGTPHPPMPQYPFGFFARYCW